MGRTLARRAVAQICLDIGAYEPVRATTRGAGGVELGKQELL